MSNHSFPTYSNDMMEMNTSKAHDLETGSKCDETVLDDEHQQTSEPNSAFGKSGRRGCFLLVILLVFASAAIIGSLARTPSNSTNISTNAATQYQLQNEGLGNQAGTADGDGEGSVDTGDSADSEDSEDSEDVEVREAGQGSADSEDSEDSEDGEDSADSADGEDIPDSEDDEESSVSADSGGRLLSDRFLVNKV